jgi:hypothetical protein
MGIKFNDPVRDLFEKSIMRDLTKVMKSQEPIAIHAENYKYVKGYVNCLMQTVHALQNIFGFSYHLDAMLDRLDYWFGFYNTETKESWGFVQTAEDIRKNDDFRW